jgi:hypothetical protein
MVKLILLRWRSSTAEQRYRKPQVAGSIPIASSIIPIDSGPPEFFYFPNADRMSHSKKSLSKGVIKYGFIMNLL